jgi:GT2 family glycosyltransferase
MVFAMKLALGVLTFNEDTRQLEKLFRSLRPAVCEARRDQELQVHVVGVDNGEPRLQAALTSSAIAQEDISTEVLPTEGNVGFGKGFNRLMAATFPSYDAFIAVNPDGVFHYDCLRTLLTAFDKYPDSLLEPRQFPDEHQKVYDLNTGDTPWATGACLLIPKRVYESIGGFDSNLFIYGEDIDISWRARAAGYSVKLVHDALFAHPTFGRKWSPRMKRLLFLSNIYLAAKWSAPDYIEKYKLDHFSRFGQTPEELADVEKMISLGRGAQQSIANLPRRSEFVPEFDDSRTFSPARWYH